MKNFILSLTLLASLFFGFISSVSATSLVAGDIAIIRLNGDSPDSWAFVLLRNIDAGTTIMFTDEGWNPNSTAFQGSGESHLTWTAPAGGLYAGTVVTVDENSDTPNTFNTSSGTTTISSGSSFSISSGGDQMLAYQGSYGSPTFIFAVQSNSKNWQTGNCLSNKQSGLPSGLTNGTTAVAAGYGNGSESEYDNIEYKFTTISGSKAEILATIGNRCYWNGTNSESYCDPIPEFSITTLPVEMVGLDAELLGSHVEIVWATASELNNDYFSIERSTDGMLFSEVGQIEGVGTTQEMNTYSFMDLPEASGTFYYRLRQVDYDGAFSFSSSIAVELTIDEHSLEIFPNPVTGPLQVRSADGINMSIYSLSGQVVYQSNLNQGVGVADLSELTPGIYSIEVVHADMSRSTRRIIR